MMKSKDLLEKDRERLLAGLSSSESPEDTLRALDNELSRIQLSLSSQNDSESASGLEAALLKTARSALPLIDSAGEAKIYELAENSFSMKIAIFPAAALLAAAGGFLLILLAPASLAPASLVLFAAACALAFLSGLKIGQLRPASAPERQIKLSFDGQKIYHNLSNLLSSIDQRVDDEKNIMEDAAIRAEGAAPLSDDLLSLLADVLEAAYRRPEDPAALSNISNIRYYLHRQGIEVVDYGKDTHGFFTLLPAKEKKTLRPALVMGKTLLMRGRALGGM
ncbi:MAG: hypothetical protein K6E30_10515 [Lachnospiraceae bacterium]|nr:hypothetical protein [Lachnospiraceae bacterium]